ncbi:pullulanase [Anaerotaenia torta]|uniref:type I pullulanase n=1 Tax=Anaerotaenia torta TaxID=433293 RepID=UPI003D2247C1
MDKQKMLEYYHRFMTKEFEEANDYRGNDLGAVWTAESACFRVWAPTAGRAAVKLYRTGDGEDLLECVPMLPDDKGTWRAEVAGDLNGVYYTYEITVDGETREAADPYARAVGVNGERGMVIDLSSTNPPGFTEEKLPEFKNAADAVIYELHIRDFSADASSGMRYTGKYLAFTEEGTVNSYGEKTGLDYLADMGITHVHLLPAFDYHTVDERKPEEQFNWGYDPRNYNVPEGSYSTDPYHGEVRIREFKQMVQALHKKGIRVVMDVVYNHTAESMESNFNRIVPGYYYRLTPEGDFSSASGCGSETASERAMMRKFILDSVLYWVREYHIDGFRFDLMGIHDIHTMNEVRRVLNEIDPGILVYGEGWTGGPSPLPDWKKALKANIKNMNSGIAVFNDDLRDAVKGNVFRKEEQGFVSGRGGLEETIKFGVAGSAWHQGVDYGRVLSSCIAPWTSGPLQTVNYVSAHDNLTLWDKLALSNPGESLENRLRMNLLSAAIIFTCQGLPFFQAGEEFLRSKPLNEEETDFEENSYRSPDSVNSLKWNRCHEYRVAVEYYKGLIAFRKAHRLLRLAAAEEMRARLDFLEVSLPCTAAFLLSGEEETICVVYNASRESRKLTIPEGDWRIYGKGLEAGTTVLGHHPGGEVETEPISALILVK